MNHQEVDAEQNSRVMNDRDVKATRTVSDNSSRANSFHKNNKNENIRKGNRNNLTSEHTTPVNGDPILSIGLESDENLGKLVRIQELFIHNRRTSVSHGKLSPRLQNKMVTYRNKSDMTSQCVTSSCIKPSTAQLAHSSGVGQNRRKISRLHGSNT